MSGIRPVSSEGLGGEGGSAGEEPRRSFMVAPRKCDVWGPERIVKGERIVDNMLQHVKNASSYYEQRRWSMGTASTVECHTEERLQVVVDGGGF